MIRIASHLAQRTRQLLRREGIETGEGVGVVENILGPGQNAESGKEREVEIGADLTSALAPAPMAACRSLLMICWTMASVASSGAGIVGSFTGFCDQSTVAGARRGEKANATWRDPESNILSTETSCSRYRPLSLRSHP